MLPKLLSKPRRKQKKKKREGWKRKLMKKI